MLDSLSVVLVFQLMLHHHTTATAGAFTTPTDSSELLTSVEFDVQEVSARDTSEDTWCEEDPPCRVDQILGVCAVDKAVCCLLYYYWEDIYLEGGQVPCPDLRPNLHSESLRHHRCRPRRHQWHRCRALRRPRPVRPGMERDEAAGNDLTG